MESVIQQQDYRKILRAKLAEKASKNKLFSLRSFAKKVGISHAFLSQILNSLKNLSRESASHIAEHLDFNEQEKEFFVTLVEYETSRNKAYREILLKKISQISPEREALQLSLEKFQCIADWYHAAILEYSRFGTLDAKAAPLLASALKISELEAKAALSRLIDLGLLVNQDGYLQKARQVILSSSEVPSKYIREHHRQMIHKAVDSLESQTVAERSITDMTIAISAEQIPFVKERIEKFKSELSSLLNESIPKDSVYQMNIQFFRLAKNQSPNPKNSKSKGK